MSYSEKKDIGAISRTCYLSHPATHCNTLQHSTTHCNTLQHTQPAICRFGGLQYSVSFWVSTPQPLIGTNLHVTWANGKWSVLQYVAVVSQCDAVCCSALPQPLMGANVHVTWTNGRWSVLQCVAEVSWCVAVCCRALQCVASSVDGSEPSRDMDK